MTPSHRWLLMLIGTSVLTGCASNDTMFFGTKTSIGVDVSSTPPTFDLAFARKELSIGPVIEQGGEPVGTLPVMSSFGGDTGLTGALFGAGASTQFATGRSAEIITRFLESDARLAIDGDALQGMIDDPLTGSVAGTRGERLYAFVTDTSLGLGVEFAAEAGGVPAGLVFGWKRKELACAPVVGFEHVRDDGKKQTRQAIPSLIATSDTDAGADGSRADVKVKQFYATGRAADYLASIPHIRKVVGEQITQVEVANAALDDARARGAALRAEAATLHASLTGGQLDDARALMLAHGVIDDSDRFDAPTGTADEIDEAKRTRLNSWARVFNDQAEIDRLDDYVQALGAALEE